MENKKEDIFENTTKFNSGIKLYMFQTGSIKTKLKFIKMNHSEEPFEIPVPWFLIKHPQGDVIIDGGMPIEAALDKHKHWGDVIEAYDPVMKVSEWCKEVVKTVNTNPEDVKYVIQTHLHLDHSGAIGHFPNATHITQRIEYDYAFNPDWFSQPAYIRADFDKPNIRWKFLQGKKTDFYDVFGDGVIKIIFTTHLDINRYLLIFLRQDICYLLEMHVTQEIIGVINAYLDLLLQHLMPQTR